MGLKWFRARMKMNKIPKYSLGVAGFYRTTSRFDGNDTRQPVSEIAIQSKTISRVLPRETEPYESKNSMASLVKPEMNKNLNFNEEQIKIVQIEEEDNECETPRTNLPRESVELMRNGICEKTSPRQRMNRMRKSDMRNKVRVPILKSMNNNKREVEI